jgi:hypothetical protein
VVAFFIAKERRSNFMELESNEKEKAVTEQSVTDAQLDSAYQETEQKLEEKKDELRDTKEELKDKDLDQKERSALGRKVKRLEDSIDEIKNLILESRKAPTQETREDDIPEYDRQTYLRLRKEEADADRKYQQVYLSNLKNIADPENHEEIMEEMIKNFNIRRGDINDPRSWRPDLDSEINYTNAKMAVLSRRLGKVKPNVRSERPASSTNISTASHSDRSATSEIELDDVAKEFVRKIGMKEESIKNALKGEAPIHLRK